MQTLIVTETAALFAALTQYAQAGAPMSVQALKPVSAVQPISGDRQEILALLQKGWPCRVIARELGVCVPTVKARLKLLYRQTGRYPQPALR